MPAAHTSSPAGRNRPRIPVLRGRSPLRAAADGFTLIEVIVVMIIMAILMAIVVPTFLGEKKAGKLDSMVVAAQSYANVVDQFTLDHGGSVPVYGQASDWVTTPTACAQYGPIQTQLLGQAPTTSECPGGPLVKPYLTSGPPEPITEGESGIAGGGGGPPSTGWGSSCQPGTSSFCGALEYVVTDPAHYKIQVWYEQGSHGVKEQCAVGSAPLAAGEQKC